MKFKFGDKVQIIKGKFHKGAIGTVVGLIVDEETNKKRYRIALDHDRDVHAHHSWLEKVTKKDEILQ